MVTNTAWRATRRDQEGANRRKKRLDVLVPFDVEDHTDRASITTATSITVYPREIVFAERYHEWKLPSHNYWSLIAIVVVIYITDIPSPSKFWQFTKTLAMTVIGVVILSISESLPFSNFFGLSRGNCARLANWAHKYSSSFAPPCSEVPRPIVWFKWWGLPSKHHNNLLWRLSSCWWLSFFCSLQPPVHSW